ncbi:aldo/keto reductase [Motilibacter deserti]|uniref:Aldo/keto reductase n=1 Tax=Motilibacter deserti TaxID=2714956 RepID=A0ABX0H1A8_9ACTN|nr:aldo/keto reductase [Motilibacter deserti]
MTSAPSVPLLHGAQLPRLGLGTSPMSDTDTEAAVAAALEIGYRLIDTAEDYGNEEGVGRGIRSSGVPRDELFVTTKFNKQWHGVDLVTEAFERSAERLGLDYVDLFLVHWPNPGHDKYVEAWQGLVRLHEQGRVRAIGVSNFRPAHLERIITETGVAPDVNQVQLHPLLVREAERAFHAERGIVTQAWSPLGGTGADVLSQPLLQTLAEKYGRSPGQIVLRWLMDLGVTTVAKSSHPERLRQNIEIFDFSLEPADVAAVSALDTGDERIFDADTFGH